MKTNAIHSALLCTAFLICISVHGFSQLQGDYTIGKGGDYETFNDAADALHSQGTFGPVTFLILPGTYNEQFVLGNINGPTESAPVIFQSQSGLTKDVELVFTPPDLDHNYIVKLSNSSHIHFKHLIFKMTSLGTAVSIGAETEYITIDSCSFSGVYNTNSYEKYALICSDDPYLENISITNNHFNNCGYGVHLAGDNYQSIKGTVVLDNQFSDIGYTAIYLAFNVAPQIENNRILSGLYGIYAPSISGSTSIQKNIISASYYGILIRNEGSLLSRGMIANNMLSVIGSEVRGIDIQSSTYTDVYHNSVSISGTDPDSRAFSCAGSLVKSINIVNNTFSALSKGYAYYINNPSCISQSDYNNYYSAGNWLAYWGEKIFDFADLRSAGAHELHSLSVFPMHMSATDLHSNSAWIKDRGIPLASVTEDIDGDLRSTLHPDIGADEFNMMTLAPLSGHYTVGSSGDYQTINEAVSSLRFRGVSGNVFIHLADPTFNEQVEIVNIPGSSPERKIVFTTPNFFPAGDSIVVSYSATEADNNFVIKLKGADFIEFRNLHLKALGTTYATVLSVDGGCDSIAVINNTLYAPRNTNNDSRRILIDSEDSYYLKRNIENNIFREGSYGVLMRRISSYKAYPKGLTIQGNEFKNSGYAAIWLQNHDAPVVLGNTVKAGTYGIGVSQGTGAYRIEKNNIDMSGQYGIRLSANAANQLYPGIVCNNFVHVGGTGNAYGISQSSCNFLNVYYNSVHITSKDLVDGRAFYSSSGSGISVKNNNFVNSGGGYSYYVVTTSAISISDYNNFYTVGTNLAYFNGIKTSLTDLQSGNSYHDHCISVNPQFASYNDLHASAEELSGAATPILSVSEDFDGDLRHLSAPDIGADEFSGGGGVGIFSELPLDLPGIRYGKAIWGDYNMDGKLDIIMSGNYLSAIYRNAGSNEFSKGPEDILYANNADISWTDCNFDNQPDLFLTGTSPTGLKAAVMYENESGTFTSVETEIEGLWNAESKWADFDNDGDYDLLISGQTDNNLGFTRIYFYKDGNIWNWDGHYVETEVGEDVIDGSLAVADYDHDGDFDFVLSGILGTDRITRLYQNINGEFVQTEDLFAGVNGGALTWGDYDSDGDLDLLICGYDGISGYITKLYENDEGGFYDTHLPFIGFVNADAEWADYDSDGDLDLLICGYTDMEQSTILYSNNNGDSFTPVDAGLPGVDFGSVAWGDCDSDGDPDILLCGDADGIPVTKVFINNTESPGSAPQGPSNLQVRVTDKNALLSWDQADDDDTPIQALTYNLEIFRNFPTGNVEVVSPLALGDGTGFTVGSGNMEGNTQFLINGLSPGATYYWKVQTIDRSYRSSAFVNGGSFTTLESIFSPVQDILGKITDGDLDFGDFDNDGDLDFIICGEADQGKITEIYTNNNGIFTKMDIDLPGVAESDVEWGDYDNDGYLDFVLCGIADKNDSWFFGRDEYSRATFIFHNNLGTSFTSIGTNIENIRKGVATWGDCDNDGDLDLLISGVCFKWNSLLGPETEEGITKIYINEGIGNFVPLNIEIEGYKYADAAWGDYDSDGDLDFIVTGANEKSVHADGGRDPKPAKIYRNDGNNRFNPLEIDLPSVKDGAVAWGDYDNDGDLDFVLTGRQADRTYIFKNLGGDLFIDMQISIPPVYDSSVDWGDLDNDGLPDLILTGNQEEVPLFSSLDVVTTSIYRNQGNGQFTNMNVNLPPVHHGCLRMADWTGDGALDLILMGNGFDHVRTYQNNILLTNSVPATPEKLMVTIGSDDIILQWNHSKDKETPLHGLAYNLKIGSTSCGEDIISPMSGTDGYRKIVRTGNAGQVNNWKIKLSNFIQADKKNDLYWSVQAVDNGYLGSPFAPIDTVDLSGAIFSVEDVPHDQGGKVTVKWRSSDLDHNIDFLKYYSIWRAIPLGKKSLFSISDPVNLLMANQSPFYRKALKNGTSYAWEWIANQPAHKLPVYSYTCSTVNDSMPGAQNEHYFMISAHTSDPNVYFDSEPMSGYSLDNLSPYAPTNLNARMINDKVELTWTASPEQDLDRFLVYRSEEPGINPKKLEALAELRAVNFTDEQVSGNAQYYYVVCARDIHGNISSASNEVSAFITGFENAKAEVPLNFRLCDLYPNPCRDRTKISFDIPDRTQIRLSIYNSKGELLSDLLNQEIARGHYEYEWMLDKNISAGVYICILEADGRKDMLRLIVMPR